MHRWVKPDDDKDDKDVEDVATFLRAFMSNPDRTRISIGHVSFMRIIIYRRANVVKRVAIPFKIYLIVKTDNNGKILYTWKEFLRKKIFQIKYLITYPNYLIRYLIKHPIILYKCTQCIINWKEKKYKIALRLTVASCMSYFDRAMNFKIKYKMYIHIRVTRADPLLKIYKPLYAR